MEMVRRARRLHTQRGSNLTIEFCRDSIQPFTTVNSMNGRGPVLFLLMVNSIMTLISGWRTHSGSSHRLIPVYWKARAAAGSNHHGQTQTSSLFMMWITALPHFLLEDSFSRPLSSFISECSQTPLGLEGLLMLQKKPKLPHFHCRA